MKMSAKEFRSKLESGEIQMGKNGKLKIVNECDFFHEVPDNNSERLSQFPELKGFIFIPGRVYSHKNSKRIGIKMANTSSKWRCRMKDGKFQPVTPFIRASKQASMYKRVTLPIYQRKKDEFLLSAKGPFPWYVKFIFVVKDKSAWDWNNLTQAVQDQMVEAGWIPDDQVKYLLPVVPLPPEQPYIIDAKQQGVYIKKMNV